MSDILTDMDRMPFGKHKDLLLANVPDAYLLWLWENKNAGMVQRFPAFYAYLEQSLDAIKFNLEKKGAKKAKIKREPKDPLSIFYR